MTLYHSVIVFFTFSWGFLSIFSAAIWREYCIPYSLKTSLSLRLNIELVGNQQALPCKNESCFMHSCKQAHCGLSIHFSSILIFATFNWASNSTREKVESSGALSVMKVCVSAFPASCWKIPYLVIFEWVIESFLRKMYHFIRFLNLLYTLNACNISHLAFEELTLPRSKQV